jgi:transcriptional regulator GlxA family with amidase domain
VTRPNRQAADQFRAITQQIVTTAANCSHFEATQAAKNAAAEVFKVASSIVGWRRTAKPSREGRPSVPRQEIIRRSLEFFERRVGDPVRVGELAAAAEVSERTLRTAFNEYFGIGPLRYLQLRQLHLVQRALKAADSEEVSVSQILVEHGLWAFSRFASRYRRLFGELPSQTLRTKWS